MIRLIEILTFICNKPFEKLYERKLKRLTHRVELLKKEYEEIPRLRGCMDQKIQAHHKWTEASLLQYEYLKKYINRTTL